MDEEIVGRKRAGTIDAGEASVALAVLRYCIGKIGPAKIGRDGVVISEGVAPEAPYKAATSPTKEAPKAPAKGLPPPPPAKAPAKVAPPIKVGAKVAPAILRRR